MRDYTILILGGIVLLLAGAAWRSGGWELVLAGAVGGVKTLLLVAPLLLCAFLIAGLIQVLLTQEKVAYWLGEGSGWRGIFLACIGGALIPGGPYVYYPIAAALLRAGASLGVLVAFVSAKNVWPVVRLPLEFAVLGPRLTVARLLTTFLIPPLLGFLAQALAGRQVEAIRENLK